ncbi:MAG: tetratricopeptide repeat protein [Deltaproteobacteria bacterium]|nr:tetratricopeptide repeat protein [Deltaproteobacteria bacterium]
MAREKPSQPQRRPDAIAYADRLARAGDIELAIAEYRRLLTAEPDDPALLTKLAQLLERAGAADLSWRTFAAAAEAFEKRGFANKATAIYAQAVELFPLQVETWKRLALSYGSRRLQADAIKALLRGQRHFAKHSRRTEAIELLAAVINIDPLHVDAGVECALLMARQGNRTEAVALLQRQARELGGPPLRRVRARLLRIAPSPAHAWHWLRAVVAGR